MIYEIMREIRNFFPASCHSGTFTIENGIISPECVSEGQYFLVEGSILNDGVWKYGTDELTDEAFTGYITLLAPPKAFLALVSEIKTYQCKYGEAGPYTSESFGGYSYTKAAGTNGTPASWQDVFRSRLNIWRKI